MPNRTLDEISSDIRETAIQAKRLGIGKEALHAVIRSEARRRQGFANLTPAAVVDRLYAIVDGVYRA